ncbi:MarR family transcriptional regulator [Aureimonas sp. SA4125]|uniref:MarR family winged helix-turn-helix transcriptional regulator n=1 Tax=Aureimonas sp. SA4125 TaxID=2826993 RepID=UPI001CC49FB3|nr:MarR family transcriptional regulator [Aureimonas sp. SA4125]BDA84659.1 MarR family transcriptional regulator [Aureimonas sp. SA4125]
MTQLMPSDSLGFLLTDVSRLFRQVFDRAVQNAGLQLTSGEIRALAHVARLDGARQAKLAHVMGVEPMTLSAYLDRLEARGLIKRTCDRTDRRAKTVSVTAAATEVFDQVRPLAIVVYDQMVQGLTDEEASVMTRALAHLRSNLIELGTDGTDFPVSAKKAA